MLSTDNNIIFLINSQSGKYCAVCTTIITARYNQWVQICGSQLFIGEKKKKKSWSCCTSRTSSDRHLIAISRLRVGRTSDTHTIVLNWKKKPITIIIKCNAPAYVQVLTKQIRASTVFVKRPRFFTRPIISGSTQTTAKKHLLLLLYSPFKCLVISNRLFSFLFFFCSIVVSIFSILCRLIRDGKKTLSHLIINNDYEILHAV